MTEETSNVHQIPRYRKTPQTKPTGDVTFSSFVAQHSPEIQRHAVDQDLAFSGLEADDLDIELMTDYSGGNVVTGYRIPYNLPNGEAIKDTAGGTGYYTDRKIFGPDATYEEKGDKYKRTHKKVAGRWNNYPYFPLGFEDAWDRCEDGKRTLAVVEGEKKAACLQKYLGIPCMGIAGVSNWREQAGKTGVKKELLEYGAVADAVVMVFDGDIERMDLNRQATLLLDGMQQVNSRVEILKLEPSQKIDDLIVEWLGQGMGLDELRGLFQSLPVLDLHYWTHQLLVNKYQLAHRIKGKGGNIVEVKPNVANCVTLLERHPAFPKLWRNLDNNKVYIGDDEGTSECREDVEAMDITKHLQINLNLDMSHTGTIPHAIAAVSASNSRRPFYEWVESLDWDGVPRIEGMFSSYCGVEDSEICREVGRKWLAGSLMRQDKPGAILDYMVILTGGQGVGKSSLPDLLWGRDNVKALIGKHNAQVAAMLTHSGLVLNHEELSAFYKKEHEELKAMITTRVDSFKLPYARNLVDMPRRSIMYGSTNKAQFLNDDPTGHRRLGILSVGSKLFDFAGLDSAREQLWAEAMSVYRAEGVSGRWGNLDTASEAASDYVMVSPHIESFDAYMEAGDWREARECVRGHYWWTTSDIMGCAGLEVPVGRASMEQRELIEHVQSLHLMVKKRNFLTSERTGKQVSTAYYLKA